MAKGIVRFTCGIIDCNFIGSLNGRFRFAHPHLVALLARHNFRSQNANLHREI
jgi:hypothetical protein